MCILRSAVFKAYVKGLKTVDWNDGLVMLFQISKYKPVFSYMFISGSFWKPEILLKTLMLENQVVTLKNLPNTIRHKIMSFSR